MSKTMIYEEDVSRFNADTGEISAQYKRRSFKTPIDVTDEFIKSSKYLSVIFAYNGIPLNLIPISYLIAERMEFKTNRVYLLKENKLEIAQILGISLHMVETHIRNLLKYDIIRRISRGCYEVNAFLFSTGNLVETRELQAHFNFDEDAYYVGAEQTNRITGKKIKKAVLDYNEKRIRDQKQVKGQLTLADIATEGEGE